MYWFCTITTYSQSKTHKYIKILHNIKSFEISYNFKNQIVSTKPCSTERLFSLTRQISHASSPALHHNSLSCEMSNRTNVKCLRMVSNWETPFVTPGVNKQHKSDFTFNHKKFNARRLQRHCDSADTLRTAKPINSF